MGYENDNQSNTPTATIDEELKSWPETVYTDIAESEARKHQAYQDSVRRVETRKRISRKIVLLILITIVISLPVFWYFLRDTQIKPVATTTTPATTPSTGIDLQNSQLSASPTENGEFYQRTEAKVASNGQEILEVIEYDFYSNKFIVNNTALKNKSDLIATFGGLREEFKDSWILIFATASLEAYEEYNLELCRNRLYAVKDMLADTVGISAKGYWGILAGEYKMTMEGISPENVEDEENKVARERGEKWLAPQRKLIVITIRAIAKLTPEIEKEIPFVVAKHVYGQGMLPRNYDAPNSTPFLLEKKDRIQNTSGSRSPSQ